MSKKTLYKILIPSVFVSILGSLFINPAFSLAQINLFGSPSASDDFVLSWSSDSYVPNTYLGKALPTRGSEIRMVIEPTKKLAQDPQKLSYRWLLDDGLAGYASGQGKSVFRFQVTKWAGAAHNVSVQILDASGNLLALKSQAIRIVNPEVLLTKTDNSYALQNTLNVGTGQQINFYAIPLFFHIEDLAQVLWQWTFADQAIAASDQKDSNLLALTIPQGKLSQTIEKNLSVSATNKDDQYQQAAASLYVNIK
jgi:hypothetical protein